ncbi:MAG: TonB-dependent receptor [Gemmatimonadaceae bacterium]|nr:TonB-dependent receptor [Gemmatimonadaceae bacterium]
MLRRCLMRFGLLVVVPLFARTGEAQTPDTISRATVSGVAHDSVAGKVLAGATVQLVSTAEAAGDVRTGITDSLGRFMFNDVPNGRYLLGFLHPVLDSLGVEPPVRELVVAGGRAVRADVAIPSARSLRRAICEQPSGRNAGVVVVGIVRDAESQAPVPGATVVAEWIELSVTRVGFTRRVPRVVATTAATGWFGLCNLPAPGAITLVAISGADSTARIEIDVSAEEFMRRDLYLGPRRDLVVRDSTPSADSLVTSPVLQRASRGSLIGVVVAAVRGEPLADARVSIVGGPQTRTDERGEWRLVSVPLGTRTLEIRALGYYPERKTVDVVAGAPSIRTAMSTMRAVLDTVRITAAPLSENMRGFMERRRGSGMGRYLTPADIARHRPVFTSDIFGRVPGLEVVKPGIMYDGGISMRGLFADRCSPAVYIDGHYMRSFGLVDIDDWVHPEEVAGIEVYSAGMVPPQFQPGMSGCGSIVIWTRIRPASANR